jgi:hypothetical protein
VLSLISHVNPPSFPNIYPPMYISQNWNLFDDLPDWQDNSDDAR